MEARHQARIDRAQVTLDSAGGELPQITEGMRVTAWMDAHESHLVRHWYESISDSGLRAIVLRENGRSAVFRYPAAELKPDAGLPGESVRQ